MQVRPIATKGSEVKPESDAKAAVTGSPAAGSPAAGSSAAGSPSAAAAVPTSPVPASPVPASVPSRDAQRVQKEILEALDDLELPIRKNPDEPDEPDERRQKAPSLGNHADLTAATKDLASVAEYFSISEAVSDSPGERRESVAKPVAKETPLPRLTGLPKQDESQKALDRAASAAAAKHETETVGGPGIQKAANETRPAAKIDSLAATAGDDRGVSLLESRGTAHYGDRTAGRFETRTWAPPQKRRIPQVVLTVGSIAVIAGLALLLIQKRPTSALVAQLQGRLTVQSRPAGAQVIIDGREYGATPLAISLSAGTHTMTVRLAGQERTAPVEVTSGVEVRNYFDFAGTSASTTSSSFGRISVVTDPPKAQVSVDGLPHGASPVTIQDLLPGEHRVAVRGETGSAERTLTIDPGSTTSLVFSLGKAPAASSPLAGWLAVSAPFETQILENNELLGTSGTSKIMLTAGRHEISLISQPLGYRETRTMEVVAGKITTLKLEPPKAALNANARPWADVVIDGKLVGQTPVANVQVPIGSHEITFRHPQLGERRQTVVVTAKGPNRVSVDLTK